MPLTTAEAFEKRHIVRKDGVSILTRPLITVAAIEAGYCVPTPMVNDAASSTECPGQMTFDEFMRFCEHNQSSCVSAREMAKATVVAAPTGVITRSELREIMTKTTDKPLSEEELDSLFATLDTENKGSFSAEALMRAIYGEEGAVCLNEVRAEEAKKETERIAREKEEERKRQEEKERREKEAAKKAEEDRKARELAESQKKEKASGCC